MRIAIVLPRGLRFDPERPDSVETVIRTFAAHLPAEDEIAVFCDEGEIYPTETIETIRVAPHGGRRRRNRRVIKALRAWQPDLVEVHQHVLIAVPIARAMGDVPVTLYRHNSLKPPKKILGRQIHHHRYRSLAKVIVVSEFLRQEFATLYPSIADRAAVVSNAVDVARWHAPVQPREKVIAYGGRPIEEKGFTELCAALAIILEQHPDWRVHLCCSAWAHRQAYSEACVEPLRAFGARFVLEKDRGWQSVAAMLQNAAIAAVPSVWQEPFGLAALEAHVAGAAVLSSGRGGLREVSGDHALFVEDVTQQTIATALCEMIENEEARIAMAEAGQARAVATYSAQALAQELNMLRHDIFKNK